MKDHNDFHKKIVYYTCLKYPQLEGTFLFNDPPVYDTETPYTHRRSKVKIKGVYDTGDLMYDVLEGQGHIRYCDLSVSQLEELLAKLHNHDWTFIVCEHAVDDFKY